MRSSWQAIAGLGTILLVTGCATSGQTVDSDRSSTAQQPEATTAAAADTTHATQSAPPSTTAGASQPVRLRPGHPQSYTVRQGDTLWGISSQFLADPWLWPEIWYLNPDIRNPHLIYPGDVIELAYGADGRPQLRVSRGRPTIKLSPQVRVESIKQAIPTIPLNKIIAFLSRTAVLTDAEWQSLPYVLAQQDGMLINAGDRFYAENVPDTSGYFDIYREDTRYIDPQTGEYLGTEGIYLGAGRVERRSQPTTLMMTSSTRPTLPGDWLYETQEQALPATFQPHAGKTSGVIMAVLDGVTQIGQFANVVINRGERNGVVPGDVLAIMQAGDTAVDPYDNKHFVTLPDERAGLLIIYKSFEKVSYGLVVRARRTMHVGDVVAPPQLSDL